jgi:hypothetical protein
MLAVFLGAGLFLGSTFAAAPTGAPGSRVAQARQGQSPNAPAALVVVSPSNMDGWTTFNGYCGKTEGASTGSVAFVTGPGTPPLGVGSFEFTVGSDGSSSPEIANANYYGLRLDQINAFSYSTYVQNSGTRTGQAPYIYLDVDYTGDNTADDLLFFEPTYQTGTYSGDTVPNQCPGIPNCVAVGSWQTWDARLGGWWSLNEGGGPPLHTLQGYMTAHPNSRIVNESGSNGGVHFATGCGGSEWANFIGNLDNVSIGYGPAPTATNTALPSATNTAAPSSTNTVAATSTDTVLPSATSTATETGTATDTVAPSATATETETGTPTEAASATATATSTGTGTPTETQTPLLAPNAPEGIAPSNYTTYDFEPDGATATTTTTSTSTVVPSTTSTTAPSTTTSTSTVVPSATNTTAPSATSTAVVSSTSTPNATATACTIKFADVPSTGEGSTFYSFIRCLACRGIVSGYPCGGPGEDCNDDNDPYYRPGANVTRGQLSKIIANSAGLNDPVAEGQQQFADVEPGDPFYLYVERLAETGAIAGYPCGESGPGEPCDDLNRPYFRPNNPATRGQISKIVSIAAGYEEDVPAEQQTFTDVPTDSPFWVFIERLASREIISGYGEASRCPETGAPCFRYNDLTTRGQMAKIAANAFFPNCQTPARP